MGESQSSLADGCSGGAGLSGFSLRPRDAYLYLAMIGLRRRLLGEDFVGRFDREDIRRPALRVALSRAYDGGSS